MPSPLLLINGSPGPQSVSAGATVTLSLASSSGVGVWSLQAVATDETNTAAAINATLSVNMSTKTATFTAPATMGSAVIFQSVVGVNNSLGRDANNVMQSSYYATAKVNVPNSNGTFVLALNEIYEQSATFGWIVEINQLSRSVSAIGAATSGQRLNGSSSSKQIVVGSAIHTVNLDTSSHGAFTAIMPVTSSTSDMQIVRPTDATIAGGSNWKTTPGAVSIASGVSIENPAAPGTFLAGPTTVTFPAANGGSYSLQLMKTELLWKLV